MLKIFMNLPNDRANEREVENNAKKMKKAGSPILFPAKLTLGWFNAG